MPRRMTAIAAVLISLGFALRGAASDHPPENLQLAGDHWTAWNPPQPAPEAQVYIVVPGDTLWELARRFYGDPYLWPQLWEQNQYILDAHWIYPGDPLIVSAQVSSAENLETVDLGGGQAGSAAPGEASGATPKDDGLKFVTPADVAAGSPVPMGGESDIYCSGYIGDVDETFPRRIIGSEAEALSVGYQADTEGTLSGSYGALSTVRYGMATADIIYVDGGRAAGLEVGQQFTVIRPERTVRHPRDGQTFGRLYRYTGRVKILSVQEESAIAEIVYACDPVTVGSMLKPFVPEPVPLARRTAMRPPNAPTSAERLEGAPIILMAQDDIVATGQDHVVYVDRGEDAEITPGDIFTIYRRHPRGVPPVVIGELAILSVHPRSSTAKIIQSRHVVYRGDLLELK